MISEGPVQEEVPWRECNLLPVTFRVLGNGLRQLWALALDSSRVTLSCSGNNTVLLQSSRGHLPGSGKGPLGWGGPSSALGPVHREGRSVTAALKLIQRVPASEASIDSPKVKLATRAKNDLTVPSLPGGTGLPQPPLRRGWEWCLPACGFQF